MPAPSASISADDPDLIRCMRRNLAIYPWFKFAQSLIFWQAIWFLYFQDAVSPAAAIALYAVYDISVTVLEVPLGVLSDRLGRRKTLIASALSAAAGSALIATGDSFAVFVVGQALIGAGAAFASGTDSATLYETLASLDRADEVEAEEAKALRFSLWGYALSALLGGGLAMLSFTATFWVSASALLVAFLLAMRMTEPHREQVEVSRVGQLTAMRAAMKLPVLRWIFVLTVMMYGFSHLPFVFGQPFIAASLEEVGFGAETPVVSGAVTAIMMGLSAVASLFALRLRETLGLTGILMLAFSMQIGLIAVLAITQSWLAIAVLFLRIVPDVLSHPFTMGRIQPLLKDEVRATYVSVQSLAGKVVFAGSLLLAAGSTSDVATLPYEDIRVILGSYVGVGAVVWIVLLLSARGSGIGNVPDE